MADLCHFWLSIDTRPNMTTSRLSRREQKAQQRPRMKVQLWAAWSEGRYAVLLALCALCFSNSLHGELVHDDVWAIVNNPDVRPGSSLRNIFTNDFWGKRMADNTSHKSYRPLCILTFRQVLLSSRSKHLATRIMLLVPVAGHCNIKSVLLPHVNYRYLKMVL